MKKLFLMMMALGVMTLVSCNGNGNTSGSAAASGDKEQAAEEVKGTVFEGENFTMTYPEILTKEGFKNEKTINARNDDNSINMSATFGETPCKPEDFKTYADNLKVMNKDYTAEDPKIEDNIMTMKFVKDDMAQTQFSVFFDEKAGVAGKMEYPVAKAAEVEALIMPMLKSMKKK